MEAPSAGQPWFAAAYEPVAETAHLGQWSNVRIFKRVRTASAARTASSATPLITNHLRSNLTDQGVNLSSNEEMTLQRLLSLYVSDIDLQRRAETRHGIDFHTMLTQIGIREVSGVSDSEIAALSERLDGIIAPLAPRTNTS